MGLREWYEKKKIPNRDRSIERLEKQYKNIKYFNIYQLAFGAMLMIVALFTFFLLNDTMSLLENAESISNFVVILFVMGACMVNLLWMLYIKYMINIYIVDNERTMIDILIYLKKHMGE